MILSAGISFTSVKRSRSTSIAESTNSDMIATRISKPSLDTQKSGIHSSLSEEDQKAVANFFVTNRETTSKLDLNQDYLTEFFSDLGQRMMNDIIDKIIPTYSQNPPQLTELLSALRPVMKSKSIKNRISRIVKKFGVSRVGLRKVIITIENIH